MFIDAWFKVMFTKQLTNCKFKKIENILQMNLTCDLNDLYGLDFELNQMQNSNKKIQNSDM